MAQINENISERLFYDVNDVMNIFGISKTKAYQIIRQLNNELKAKGCIFVAGKVSRDYAAKKFGINLAEVTQ